MDEASKTFVGLKRLHALGFRPRAILDIGAHNGDWARGVRKIFPDAFVMMIDGLEEKRAVLDHTSRQMENAGFRIALLGQHDAPSTPFFVVNAGPIQTGSSRFRENTNHPVEERQVAQSSLDTLLADVPVPAFDFIKLDIQGGELDALAGGQRALASAQVVLMEVAVLPYNEGAPLLHQVVATMHGYGFDLFDVLDEIRFPSGCLFQFDALFIRPDAAFKPRPPY